MTTSKRIKRVEVAQFLNLQYDNLQHARRSHEVATTIEDRQYWAGRRDALLNVVLYTEKILGI